LLWTWIPGALLGAAAAWLITLVRKRVLRRRLVGFFGEDALARGVDVAMHVLEPLSTERVDDPAQMTRGYKLRPRNGGFDRELRPVYSAFLQARDFDAFENVYALLRRLGAPDVRLRPDAAILAQWNEQSCAVCLGSPFINVVLGRMLDLDGASAPVTAVRPTESLESYRLRVLQPERLTLGVSESKGLGVITRVPNPAGGPNHVVGVWGCRAESTLSAAQHLCANFDHRWYWSGGQDDLYKLGADDERFVLVLGVEMGVPPVARAMYVSRGRDILVNDQKLLAPYLRDD
jgi:hypothetical protein